MCLFRVGLCLHIIAACGAVATTEISAQPSKQGDLPKAKAAPRLTGEGWIYLECRIEKSETYIEASKTSEEKYDSERTIPRYFAFREESFYGSIFEYWNLNSQSWVSYPRKSDNYSVNSISITDNFIKFKRSRRQYESGDEIWISRLQGSIDITYINGRTIQFLKGSCKPGEPNIEEKKF